MEMGEKKRKEKLFPRGKFKFDVVEMFLRIIYSWRINVFTILDKGGVGVSTTLLWSKM